MEEVEIVNELREALMPAMNYWQHIAVGLLGAWCDGSEYSFETLMKEPLRFGGIYFQVCSVCRANTTTVRQFLAKEEAYEKARLEALEILDRMTHNVLEGKS
jgi:hypothetical protein